jgi:hypothetical protein
MVSACSHSSLDIVVGLGMKIVVDHFPLFSSTLEFGAREPGRDVLHCIESVRIVLREIKGSVHDGKMSTSQAPGAAACENVSADFSANATNSSPSGFMS